MPNWVQCRVIGMDTQALHNALLNENNDVDFNKVIPMPEDLNITSGSGSYEVPNAWGFGEDRLKLQRESVDSMLDEVYNDTMTQADFIKACKKKKVLINTIKNIRGWQDDENVHFQEFMVTFLKGAFNYRRYGSNDWYNWSCDNWGTKWNASETEVLYDGSIEFQTAWSMPEGVFMELAKITPIRVAFADEDMGCNCGVVDYFINEDGEVECRDLFEESLNTAMCVWGYDFDSYYECYGDYEDEEIEDSEDMDNARADFESLERDYNSAMSQYSLKLDYECVG